MTLISLLLPSSVPTDASTGDSRAFRPATLSSCVTRREGTIDPKNEATSKLANFHTFSKIQRVSPF